jgi:hypothetical protein
MIVKNPKAMAPGEKITEMTGASPGTSATTLSRIWKIKSHPVAYFVSINGPQVFDELCLNEPGRVKRSEAFVSIETVTDPTIKYIMPPMTSRNSTSDNAMTTVRFLVADQTFFGGV